MNESEKDEKGKETKSKRSATKGSQTVPGLYTYTQTNMGQTSEFTLKQAQTCECDFVCIRVCVSTSVGVSEWT